MQLLDRRSQTDNHEYLDRETWRYGRCGANYTFVEAVEGRSNLADSREECDVVAGTQGRASVFGLGAA